MTFSLEKFKKNYAAPVIKLMYFEGVFLFIWLMARIFIPSAIPGAVQWASAILVIILFPLTICYYVDLKAQAERQFQNITHNTLFVERVLEFGLSGGGFVNHRVYIYFNRVDDVKFTKRWIVLTGEIRVVDLYNEVTREKIVTKYRVPRTFTNEEEIVNLCQK